MIKCKWSKHPNEKAEIVILDSKASPNHAAVYEKSTFFFLRSFPLLPRSDNIPPHSSLPNA